MLKSILKIIKYKYLEFKYDMILKKSKYHTWGEYLYYNDIKFDKNGKTAKDMFIGYPYLMKIDKSKLPIVEYGLGYIEDLSPIIPIINICRIHNFEFKIFKFYVSYEELNKNVYNLLNQITGIHAIYVIGFTSSNDMTEFVLYSEY